MLNQAFLERQNQKSTFILVQQLTLSEMNVNAVLSFSTLPVVTQKTVTEKMIAEGFGNIRFHFAGQLSELTVFYLQGISRLEVRRVGMYCVVHRL